MFIELRRAGNEFISLINPSDAVTLVAGFKAVAAAWFVSYVIYIGWLYATGKNSTPFADIIQRFVVYSIIAMFAFNIGGWFDLTVSAVKALSSWANTAGTGVSSGAGTIYGKLDKGWSMLIDYHEQLMSKVNFFEVLGSMERLFSMSLIYGSYALVALYVTILLILNEFILTVVLYTFPIAVITLYFSWTKGVFERWLEIAISNILNILFISLMFNTMFNKVANYVNNDMIDKGDTMAPLTVAFSFVFLMIFVFAFIRFGVLFSEKLARVSANSLPISAMKSTAGGAVMGGYAGGKMVGKSYDATKATIGGVSKVSSGIGNIVSSSHSMYRNSQSRTASNTLRANRLGGINTSSSGGGGSSGRATYRPVPLGGVASPKARNNGGINTSNSGGDGSSGRATYRPVPLGGVASPKARNNGGIYTSSSGGGGSSGRATYRPVPLGGVASPKARNNGSINTSNSGSRGNKSGSTKWGKIGAINKHRRT